MQCKEWDDANSELFKESHDEAVHKISYESRLYELISASSISVHLAHHAEIVHLKCLADSSKEWSVKHGPVNF